MGCFGLCVLYADLCAMHCVLCDVVMCIDHGLCVVYYEYVVVCCLLNVIVCVFVDC